MSGIFDKLGNWYEEEYILFECLRMLNGFTEEVKWEGTLDEGKGIDCWIRENGIRTAVQCKTHSTGIWKPSELRGPFEWAREQLARTDFDAPAKFRFVTDASMPEKWEEKEIADSFVASRTEIRVVNASMLRVAVESLARNYAEKGFGALLDRLRNLARSSLTRKITPQSIHDALSAAGISPRSDVDLVGFGNTLARLRALFVSDLKSSRRNIVDHIPRDESTQIVERLLAFGPPKKILVHAEGGYGKSEILGAVVQELENRKIATLVVRADAIEDVVATQGIPRDPIAALRSFVGTAKAVIVIDQIDRVARAGSSAQRALLRIKDWLLAATGQFDVVIGCRTLDAKHDSQIGEIVDTAAIEVPVALLPEAIAQEKLAQRGVPFADLSPEVRRMSRIPFILRCMLDLASKRPAGAWREARSTRTLVLDWWDVLLRGHGEDAKQIIDRIVDGMERDGIADVDRDNLPDPRSKTIDALVHEGALVEHKSRLRIAHQVLSDVWIARRWQVCRTFGELFQKLGAKKDQDLHTARQLRLTTTMFRMETAASIFDAVIRSNDVRMLLKQSMLLGLAELDPIDPPILERVMSWLDDDTLFERVISTVIIGQRAWFEALEARGWIASAWNRWSTGHPTHRDALLRLLRGVSITHGDEVAKYLHDWGRVDPNLRDQAFYVFWQDPSADTDDFFDLRLTAPDSILAQSLIDWSELVRRNPRRALRLLGRTLRLIGSPELLQPQSRNVASRWPTANGLPAEFVQLGLEVWDEVASWWKELEIDALWRVHTETSSTNLLPNIVETLARCFAFALAERRIDWNGIVAKLPTPERPVDEWLLLEIGASARTLDPDCADQAAEWFIGRPSAVLVRIGTNPWRTEMYELPGTFVESIASRCSEDALRRLESFLILHPGTWTSEDERWRAENTGFGRPSEFGLVAYRLLERIPASRLGAEARGRLGTLQEKFDPLYKHPESSYHFSWGGQTSVVPESVAMRWTPEHWRKEFDEAPDHDLKRSSNQRAHTKETLSALLSRLASKDPRRYLVEFAPDFVDPKNRVHPRILERLLRALHSARVPGNDAEPERYAIRTDEFAPIIYCVLDTCDELIENLIANILSDRPEFEWSIQVLELLARSAKSGTWVSLSAVSALAQIASRHEQRRQFVLEVADSVAQSADPHLRAVAVRAAACCYESLGDAALEVAIEAAQSIIGSQAFEVVHTLCFTASRSKQSELRLRARQRLCELARSSDRDAARAGGAGLMQLRLWNLIDATTLQVSLERADQARSSAADIVRQWMEHHSRDEALETHVLEFANDPNPEVHGRVFYALRTEGGGRWLDDAGFALRLLATTGAKDPGNQSDILTGFDRRGSLLPIADRLLEIARMCWNRTRSGHEPSSDWESDRVVVEAVARLHRLVEECEREQNFEIRAEALDVLDELLLVAHPAAREATDARTR